MLAAYCRSFCWGKSKIRFVCVKDQCVLSTPSNQAPQDP